MKNNNHPSLYFSPLSAKSIKQEEAAKSAGQSPYLKAVLSDKRPAGRAGVLAMGNSSMAAALRYISNNK